MTLFRFLLLTYLSTCGTYMFAQKDRASNLQQNVRNILFADGIKQHFTSPMQQRLANLYLNRFGLAPVLVNGKWGVIDRQGNYLIPAEYKSVMIKPRIGTVIEVSKKSADDKSSLSYYRFKKGQLEILNYCGCSPTINQWSGTSNDPFYNAPYMHIQGYQLFRCYYDEAQTKLEIVSQQGNLLVDTVAFALNETADKHMAYYVNDQRVISSVYKSRSLSLHMFMQEIYFSADKGDSRYSLPSKQGKMLVNEAGDTIIPGGKYEQFEHNFSGTDPGGNITPNILPVIDVMKDGKWGLIDKNGNMLAELQFDSKAAYRFHYGTTGTVSGKSVFLDTLGRKFDFGKYEFGIVHPNLHRELFFTVGLNGKYGVVDKNLKVIVPFDWDGELDIFAPGNMEDILFVARNDFRTYVYNVEGKRIFQCKESASTKTIGAKYTVRTKKHTYIFNPSTSKFQKASKKTLKLLEEETVRQ